jgi:acetyl-CoA C-acetyltransferase
MHAVDLLGEVQRAALVRAGVDPSRVSQVVAGCVGQVGMQAMNVGRTAWLTQGMPFEVPTVTVDAQCGSAQEAATLATALIRSGAADVVLACGVEVMSKVKMGSTVADKALGRPINRNYWKHREFTSQFEGAERVAKQWGLTRADTDALGVLSQARAKAARDAGHFDGQYVTIEAPVLNEQGEPTGETTTVSKDEGIRDTTLEALAGLKATAGEGGIHTAATSSQISDGASAVLLMSAEAAADLGVTPLGTIVDTAFVGSDPVLMLTGPIPATHKMLNANKMTIADIDLVEINEAFASIVLAWQAEFKVDIDVINPNGGAIALGHPLGATGTALITKAIHELHRSDKEHALVTMCCGGGLGTGTLIRRS